MLGLVEARQRSGSTTRLELAQQRSLVAAQERQVPLLEQQWQNNRITLATLLGDPVQALPNTNESIATLRWPAIGSGVPSDLLGRRPTLPPPRPGAAASANASGQGRHAAQADPGSRPG